MDIEKTQLPDQQANREGKNLMSVFRDGPCPKVDLMQQVQYEKLAGDWYLFSDTCPISRMTNPECNHFVLDI